MASMTSHDMESETKDATRQAQEKAGQAVEKAQQQVKDLAGEAQVQAKSMLDTRKEQAVGELSMLAQAIYQTSDELRNLDKGTVARYTDQMAGQLDRFSSYLEQHNIDDLLNEAEDFARRRPEVFLGGALALGILAARFLKSSGQRRGAFREGEMSWEEYQATRSYPAQRDVDTADTWTTRRMQTRESITEEW